MSRSSRPPRPSATPRSSSGTAFRCPRWAAATSPSQASARCGGGRVRLRARRLRQGAAPEARGDGGLELGRELATDALADEGKAAARAARVEVRQDSRGDEPGVARADPRGGVLGGGGVTGELLEQREVAPGLRHDDLVVDVAVCEGLECLLGVIGAGAVAPHEPEEWLDGSGRGDGDLVVGVHREDAQRPRGPNLWFGVAAPHELDERRDGAGRGDGDPDIVVIQREVAQRQRGVGLSSRAAPPHEVDEGRDATRGHYGDNVVLVVREGHQRPGGTPSALAAALQEFDEQKCSASGRDRVPRLFARQIHTSRGRAHEAPERPRGARLGGGVAVRKGAHVSGNGDRIDHFEGAVYSQGEAYDCMIMMQAHQMLIIIVAGLFKKRIRFRENRW